MEPSELMGLKWIVDHPSLVDPTVLADAKMKLKAAEMPKSPPSMSEAKEAMATEDSDLGSAMEYAQSNPSGIRKPAEDSDLDLATAYAKDHPQGATNRAPEARVAETPLPAYGGSSMARFGDTIRKNLESAAGAVKSRLPANPLSAGQQVAPAVKYPKLTVPPEDSVLHDPMLLMQELEDEKKKKTPQK